MRFVDNLLVMVRVFVEAALNLGGYLNVNAIFSRNHSPRKCVAFQAYSVHLAQFYQTIVSELLQSPEKIQVKFVILLHPHFSFRAAFELKEFAQSKLHLPAEDIKFHWQVLWERFDLLICSDVYAKFPIRKTKTCLLTHGPGLTRRFFYKQAFRKSVADFDLILVSGNYDGELVRSFVSPETVRVYSVGVPILDVLKPSCISKALYFRRRRLDPSKRTVLFAPHWKTLAAIDGDANNYFDDVVSVLKTLDVNVLIKLHACSLNPAMGGTIDWRAKLKRLSSDASVRVDEDVDDLPALKHANVLITDISSRAFNFMLLGKPVILYCPIPLDNVSDRIRISTDTRYQLASEPIDKRWIGENLIAHSQAE